MRPRRLLMVSVLAGLAWPAPAQDAALPAQVAPGNEDPVLRLEGGGPLSPVSAVAFGPDGATLYEAGWDKVVRVWRRDPGTGLFGLDPASSLRVPIGPGDAGVLNALAVSADGAWLAVGGNAVLPEAAGFRQVGVVVPRSGVTDPGAQGVIYVFDLRAQPARCRLLRGHRGPVQALTFADVPAGQPALLLSAGSELPDQGAGDRRLLVLRLWDVDAKAERDRVVAGEFRQFRPWLAAWSLPPDHARVRAAAAWTDSSFLVWDAGNAPPKRVGDPFKGRSLILSARPDRGELLTGHFGEPPAGQRWPEGYLVSWDAAAPAAGVRQKVLSWSGAEPGPPDLKGVPVAQAVVSSRPGGPRDLLAVVLRAWKPPGPPGTPPASAFEYRLQLLDLDPPAFGTVRAQVGLWTGPMVQPFAAPSPDGGRLAVVGDPENEILVHDVDRLLQDRPEPQKLRGVGESIGAAAVVRKGPDWGLRVRRTPHANRGEPPPPVAPGDLVFDFTNRRFAPSPEGWTVSAPAPSAWQTALSLPPPDEPSKRQLLPWHLFVYENRRPVAGIPFDPESPSSPPDSVVVTDFALRPPMPPFPDPVVAVALDEPAGVGPSLWLYNGRSGERFRKLTGHTGTVRSVAFSGDGRFLVSSADDRTACVWSLTDLDQVLRARGTLPGLVLSERDGRFVVTDLRRGPLRGRDDLLRVGDVVEGFVEGGRLVVPASVAELHLTAFSRKPGETVTLRRRRAGEGPRDVRLALAQATDERKPLVTLFTTRPGPGPGQAREWLAWNPFGPYDASGPGVESLFGWHFNEPSRPEAPARFALAAQYPKFRREGLLRDLIDAGRLRPPPAPEPIEPPEMELFLDPGGHRDGHDRLIVQRPPTRLGLAIDDGLPPENVGSVTWRLDDGPTRPMSAEALLWSADLSGVAWDRRPHKLTVVLETREPSQRFTTSQVVRYVPPPPRVVPRGPQGIAGALTTGLNVNDPRFRFAADVEPAAGLKARARLVWRHGDRVLLDRKYGPDFAGEPVDATLKLEPGANTIELEAVNEGAGDGLEGYETERFGPLTVYFRPDPVSPPTIQVDRLVLLPEAPGGPPDVVKVGGTDLGVVEAPRARLEGRITAGAKAAMLSAELQYAGKEWKPFEGFAPDLKSFAFRESLDLVEGRQTIRLRARADNGVTQATQEATLTIAYHPSVPRLGPLAAEPLDPLEAPGTEERRARVRLSAKVLGAAAHHPVESATVLLDDEPLPDPPALDRGAGTLSALVGLHAGVNRLKVRLSNRWGSATYGPAVLQYRRPPLVGPAEARPRDGRPSAAVSARVRSLTALTRAEVEVVHRSASPTTSRVQSPRPEAVGDDWVIAAEVPLEPGENEIIVRTWNADGPSPAVSRRLTYEKPVEPKPEVLVETPEKVVRRPVFALRFRVRSPSPLERVRLSRIRAGGTRTPVEEFEGRQMVRRPDGAFEPPAPVEVGLEPYENAFELVAVNAGGESAADLVLSYAPPPVRAEIVGVESRADPDKRVAPKYRVNGPPFLPAPLADGRATIHGRVVWADDDARRASGTPRVQVWVNGFPQVAAELEAVGNGRRARESEFHARVLLSQPENEIAVKLRDVPLDIHGAPKLLVTCRKAERNVRLHLWVIGIGIDDRPALLARAVEAFKGRMIGEPALKGEPGGDPLPRFTTPAFPVAFAYGPDGPSLERGNVYHQLKRIAENIPLGSEPANDVVMIYYQGGEVVGGEQPSLRIRPGSDRDKNSLFPLSEIQRHLGGTRGAKLFLLDVSHPPGQEPAALILAESARWTEDDSPFGLLRFSWPGQTAPPETDLAVTLREALQKAVTLGQVSEEVGRRSAALRRETPGLLYRSELTPPLQALIVGGP
jgi:hypothetical protein